MASGIEGALDGLIRQYGKRVDMSKGYDRKLAGELQQVVFDLEYLRGFLSRPARRPAAAAPKRSYWKKGFKGKSG